jgi:hypothetical protein
MSSSALLPSNQQDLEQTLAPAQRSARRVTRLALLVGYLDEFLLNGLRAPSPCGGVEPTCRSSISRDARIAAVGHDRCRHQIRHPLNLVMWPMRSRPSFATTALILTVAET